MVTDEERDYMYQTYASDPQMRINGGIRRRLAPLMENSRRRIELMNSLLFSLPGTPVIYYGDEIGMGDNIYLGDRNGVRTPMQWTGDRNGGFSRADAARLYAPRHHRSGLWLQRRQRRSAGAGAVLAPQLDEAAHRPAQTASCLRTRINRVRHVAESQGPRLRAPGRDRHHAVRGQPVTKRAARGARSVTLPRHGAGRDVRPDRVSAYRRSARTSSASAPTPSTGITCSRLRRRSASARRPDVPGAVPEAPALFVGTVWDTLLDGTVRTLIERDLLAGFLHRQSWFQWTRPRSARFKDWGLLRRGAEPIFVTIVEAELDDPSAAGGTVTRQYFLPLALASGDAAKAVQERFPAAVVARVSGARKGALYDAWHDTRFVDHLLEAVGIGHDDGDAIRPGADASVAASSRNCGARPTSSPRQSPRRRQPTASSIAVRSR